MPIGMNSKGEIVGPTRWLPSPVPRDMSAGGIPEIQITEASCDKCGAMGVMLYELRYATGQRIGSIFCQGCAEARRDELME